MNDQPACAHSTLYWGSGNYYVLCKTCSQKWVACHDDRDEAKREGMVHAAGVGARVPEAAVMRAVAAKVELHDAIGHAFLAAVEAERPCPFCEAPTNNVYPFAEHDCVAAAWVRRLTDALKSSSHAQGTGLEETNKEK